MQDPIERLLTALLSQHPLLARHLHSHQKFPTLFVIHKIWRAKQTCTEHTGFTQYALLWNNLALPELAKLEGFDT